ncbi:hypothetical protein F4824DRAFT_501857 [Ustulina deusta]|nr:hypothetical protein F4824DRAFT_501857 [Ustulina deusta]
MRDMLNRLGGLIRSAHGPLRGLGGGTDSATSVLVPLPVSWDIPVEYTFTDLSLLLVVQAHCTLGKEYLFRKCAVQDIEKPPSDELAGQQHGSKPPQPCDAQSAESTRNIR